MLVGLLPFVTGLQESKSEIPVNAPAYKGDVDILHRSRDRAVFGFIHDKRPGEFDAVRAAFVQGDHVSDNSGFRLRTHVQISLQKDTCVLGWFLPPKAKLLSTDEYSDAMQLLAEAKKKVTAAKKAHGRTLRAQQAGG